LKQQHAESGGEHVPDYDLAFAGIRLHVSKHLSARPRDAGGEYRKVSSEDTSALM